MSPHRPERPDPDLPDRGMVGTVVRVALLVRLAALAVAAFGLGGQHQSPQVYGAVLLLGLSSFVGLARPAFLDQLIRHPVLAMSDLVLVVAVFVVLGVESPLSLAALSTSFLIGLLYSPPMAALLAGVLALSFAGQALVEADQRSTDAPFLLVLGLPLTFCCLALIGQAVVRAGRAQLAAERRFADLVQASAAAEERSRLAREMHDSLAKSLQGLALGAAALPAWVERDDARARSEADALAAGAQRAVSEARTLLTRMRADAPARPFHEVVQEVLDAWQTQHGRAVHAVVGEVSGLAPDARYELMAALREALENVRRHAPGAPVSVELRERDGGVAVVVRDGGPGFDPAQLPDREAEGHFGVRGLAERMELVGGRAELGSAPGWGTTVQLWVPFTEASLLPRG